MVEYGTWTTDIARWRRNVGVALLACATLISAACSDDDGGDGGKADAGALDGGNDGGSDGAGDAGDASGKVNTLLPDGDYLLGIKLSLGGAQLGLKASVTATGEAGKGGTIDTFDLYGANADGWVSEAPIASAKAIAVAADGTFTVALGKVIVPPLSSPTGTEVEAELSIAGSIGEGVFCGDITGNVPAFKADLKGSTFFAAAWTGKVTAGYEIACPGAGAKVYEAIKTCPTLKAGTNTMVSATFDRTFELYLPAQATDTQAKLPIVFLYHGNTGDAAAIIKETGWDEVASKHNVVLVVPNTTAKVDGSKPVLDWRYAEKVFGMDNRELVFFDDLRGCIGKQFGVDAGRLYVTGMSAGGLMSTFLSAHRSEAIAAAAPLSGGYLHDWPKDIRKVPMLITWGGPTDTAYSQNFDKLAATLIAALDSAGHVHADCNHGLGHKIPVGFSAHAWAWLQAFTVAGTSDAHGGKLPEGFPSYCTPAKAK